MISGSCSISIPDRRILPLFGGQSDAWSGTLGVFWPQTARKYRIPFFHHLGKSMLRLPN